MVLGDGVVVKGEGVVDESALTGESEPVHKKVGSAMLSGTVVQNGYMEVRLTTNTAGSTLSRLNQAVLEVQADRGEYARLVDQFSLYWTPGVLLTAFLFIVIGGGITKDWHLYLYRGLVLLVLACPCAIVIAAPIPAVCAISSAAKHGVLIRGSSVIERMGRVNAVALDKTGTLTKGFFKVNERIRLSEAVPTFDPLQLAAAIEQKSTHPLANAVVAEFCGCIAEAADSIVMPSVRKIAVVDGMGVTGWVNVGGDWKQVSIGNEKLLQAQGGKVALTATQQQKLDAFVARSVGGVTLLVVVDDQLEMALSLSDEVRADAGAFVSTLRGMNLTVSMITGDHGAVARSVSRQVGIREEDCFSRLLPSDKLAWVQDKQNPQRHKKNSTSEGLGTYNGLSGSEEAVRDIELAEPFISADDPVDWDSSAVVPKAQRVLMVGDGINDSTALTAASVGVAMGAGGSAMAVNSADVVLMTDNLHLIPSSIKLCQMARRTIIEGFVFAIVVKITAIVLAILGRLAFWQAIIIDIGSLVVVVINGTKPLYATGLFKQRKVEGGGVLRS
jgi:Cd2+/Zn2+-exporting ATPase